MTQNHAAMLFDDPQMQKAAEAILSGNTTALEKALQKISNINAAGGEKLPDKPDITLLILAVQNNQLDSVKTLIQHGADPNYNPQRTRNALARATWLSKPDIFYYLMQHGGNPNLKNYRGDPLTFDAASQLHFEEMWYLIDHGADMNAKGLAGETLMLYLADLNQFEQIAKLIEKGADYSIPDAGGTTVAFIAQNRHVSPAFEVWRKKVIQLLQDRGVKFPVPHPPIWDPQQHKLVPYPGPSQPIQ